MANFWRLGFDLPTQVAFPQGRAGFPHRGFARSLPLPPFTSWFPDAVAVKGRLGNRGFWVRGQVVKVRKGVFALCSEWGHLMLAAGSGPSILFIWLGPCG